MAVTGVGLLLPFDAVVILPFASTVILAFVYEPTVTPVVESAVALCVPVTSPDKLPVKFVAVVAVVALVAVEALPFSAAVIVPAEKFPEPSRATMALAVLFAVAVVAELGILVSPAPLPVNEFPALLSVTAPVNV